MPGYQNVMELLVEQMYSSVVSTLDCCACPLCKADIIAYALNQLPPKYVALREGEAYPKLFILQKEYRTRVAAALVHAGGCGAGKSPAWLGRLCCPRKINQWKEELRLLFFI